MDVGRVGNPAGVEIPPVSSGGPGAVPPGQLVGSAAHLALQRTAGEAKHNPPPLTQNHTVSDVNFEVQQMRSQFKVEDMAKNIDQLKGEKVKEYESSKLQKGLKWAGRVIVTAAIIAIVVGAIIFSGGGAAAALAGLPWLMAGFGGMGFIGGPIAMAYLARKERVENIDHTCTQWAKSINDDKAGYERFLNNILKKWEIDRTAIEPPDDQLSDEELIQKKFNELHSREHLSKVFQRDEPKTLFDLWNMQKSLALIKGYDRTNQSRQVDEELENWGEDSIAAFEEKIKDTEDRILREVDFKKIDPKAAKKSQAQAQPAQTVTFDQVLEEMDKEDDEEDETRPLLRPSSQQSPPVPPVDVDELNRQLVPPAQQRPPAEDEENVVLHDNNGVKIEGRRPPASAANPPSDNPLDAPD